MAVDVIGIGVRGLVAVSYFVPFLLSVRNFFVRFLMLFCCTFYFH
jgi:hypothetical protein